MSTACAWCGIMPDMKCTSASVKRPPVDILVAGPATRAPEFGLAVDVCWTAELHAEAVRANTKPARIRDRGGTFKSLNTKHLPVVLRNVRLSPPVEKSGRRPRDWDEAGFRCLRRPDHGE